METVLKGIIETVFPVEIKSSFEKRVFWLTEVADRYAMTWSLELNGNDTAIINRFKTGERVTCNVKIRGFKWKKEGKVNVFNTLQCTMIKSGF